MMRKLSTVLFTALLILSFSGCSFIENKIAQKRTQELVAQINANADFAIPLLTDLDDFDKTDFNYVSGWFGGEQYYPSKYGDENADPIALYFFSGYPDVSDDWVLTGVSFSDPEMSLYGLTVGSSLADCRTVMEEKGFERTDGNERFEKYQNQLVTIVFELTEGGVTGISVDLQSTNRYGIVF